MKVSKVAILAALGLLVSPAVAQAACPANAVNSSVNAGPSWLPGAGIAGVVSANMAPGVYVTDVDPAYDANCSTPATIGFGRAVSGELEEYIANNGPDGFPGTGDDVIGQRHVVAPSAVLGPNNSAFGNGSSVYGEEEYTQAGPDGVLGTADDVVLKRPVPVSNGTAIGANSHVGHDNSTAIGAGSKSTDTNQVTLGTKDETIRAEGITSQKSKDRQVGPTELVTSDSGGRLATDGGQTFARIDSAEQAITANTALLSQHSARLDTLSKGVAISMALPDVYVESNKRFSIAGNIGGFDGETALGFGAALRLDETWSVNGKLGTDTEFNEMGWTVGARASW